MKNYTYSTATLITVFALALNTLSASTVFKNTAPFEKKVHKEFTVNADVKVELDNRFGKIHVNTWDKNTVSIDVVLSMDARDQADADKVLDNIVIETSGTKSLVSAETVFKNKLKNKNNDLSIDYTVNVPRKAAMDITNRFGDIYTGDLDGPCTIDLQYGAMRLGSLNNKVNKIDMQFSEGGVDFLAFGEVGIQYSEMEIEKGGGLIIKSQFSELEIGPAGDLHIDSQYDDVDIEGAAKVVVDIQFGELEIELVSKELQVVSAYSDVVVDLISKDLEQVFVDNRFGDTKLNIANGVSYILDAKGSFSDIDLPANFNPKEKKIGTTSWHYVGPVGSESPNGHSVTIMTSYGDVKLD